MELSSVYGPFLISVGGFLLSVFMLPAIIRAASRNGWLSPQDFRRKQVTRVPLLGGVAVAIPVLLFSSVVFPQSFWYWLLAALLVLSGAYDDIRQMKALPKFLIQTFSVVSWVYMTPQPSLLLVQVGLYPLLAQGLTAFWVLGMMNAMNMIDGMDGEASSISLIVALFALTFPITIPQVYFFSVFSGSILAFLIYNRPPARIYLGDAGSVFLGFFLATQLSVLPINHGHQLLSPLFLLAVPGIDALMAMWRRWQARSQLFSGDHDHIHHKLQKIGFGVQNSLVLIAFITLHCALTARLLYSFPSALPAYALTFLCSSALITILGFIYYTEHRSATHVSSLSKTLLHETLEISPIPLFDPANFQATVYDLLPYYKELQRKGIAEVKAFIGDFSAHLKTLHPTATFSLVGSYTILAFEPSYQVNSASNQNIVSAFTRILHQHQVVKNDGIMPWGLSFYSSQQKGREFIEKFGLGANDVTNMAVNKAG